MLIYMLQAGGYNAFRNSLGIFVVRGRYSLHFDPATVSFYAGSTLRLFVRRRPDIMSFSLALRIAGYGLWAGSHVVAMLLEEPRLPHSLLRFAES
jgi:hypothetical protein